MGAFFKAFWTRLGRNTGNRVSNAIFGDKWSTPYRVAVNNGQGSGRGGRRSSAAQAPGRQTRHIRGGRTARSASAGSRRWPYWLAGTVLFCGTYNAILYPTKEDIVWLVMLWIVAIVWLIVKLRK